MLQPFRNAMLATCVCACPAWAGEADVLSADAVETARGIWRFSVTVSHADEGWDHYANRFEIVAQDGRVLGVRTLFHPHVDEQPFTRSLGGLALPEAVERVTVRAGDSVHETGGKEVTVELSPLRRVD